MANELALEDINVAEILDQEAVKEASAKLKEAIEADPEANEMVQAAESVEDVYAVVKHFANVTLEQMKVIFHKVVDYFKGPKTELPDEVLDNVAGGWSFSSWWKENKVNVAVAGAIVGACLLGIATGGLFLGAAGAAAGAVLFPLATGGAIVTMPYIFGEAKE